LKTHNVIAREIDEFLAFIGNAKLVIHNAQFDMKFLNAELIRMKRPPLSMSQSIDTVSMARRKFPGAQASLDALCRRFAIDNSARTKHGALLDAELLAEVYLELIGGRQQGFTLEENAAFAAESQMEIEVRPVRPHAASDDEQAAHTAFLETLTDPIWKQ
ncbi:MAG: exonuclease domain-containing protein, partial [Sneathiella sp.]